MVDEDVRLKEWPGKNLDAKVEHRWPEKERAKVEHHWADEEYAKLEHHFKLKGPCPVKVSFDEVPARVILENNPERPFAVNMNMNVSAKEPIHHVVCVKLCEPVCSKTDYTIGFNMMRNPFAQVSVSGQTKIFNCPPPREVVLTCVRFNRYKAGMTSETGLVVETLTFRPLGGILETEMEGDPAGVVKLGFDHSGVRIGFPSPSRDVKITVSNYGSREISFTIYSGNDAVSSFGTTIYHSSRQVTLWQTDITAVEVRGGSNEASIVEVCYLAEKKSDKVVLRGVS